MYKLFFNIDPDKKHDKQYIKDRNSEYLVRARRKAASMLKLDYRRFPQDPVMKGTGKDCYLIELKGFDKNNPQKGDTRGTNPGANGK